MPPGFHQEAYEVSGKVQVEGMGIVDIKRAFQNPAGLGDSLVVAAVAGRKIRVLSGHFMATLANVVHFRSNTTAIGPSLPLGANGGFSLNHNRHGWYETAVGEALNVNLGIATATGVGVTYIEVI